MGAVRMMQECLRQAGVVDELLVMADLFEEQGSSLAWRIRNYLQPAMGVTADEIFCWITPDDRLLLQREWAFDLAKHYEWANLPKWTAEQWQHVQGGWRAGACPSLCSLMDQCDGLDGGLWHACMAVAWSTTHSAHGCYRTFWASAWSRYIAAQSAFRHTFRVTGTPEIPIDRELDPVMQALWRYAGNEVLK